MMTWIHTMLTRLIRRDVPEQDRGDQIRRERSARIMTALRTERHRVNAEEVTMRQRDWFEGALYSHPSQTDQRQGARD